MYTQLADKEEIRELISRYCLYVDAGRGEEWAGLFTEDGVLDSPVMGRFEGRAKLLEMMQKYAEFTGDSTQPRHFISGILIDFENPEHAFAECYFLMMHAEDGKTIPVLCGRYEIRAKKVDGVWRFSEFKTLPDHELKT